MGRKVITKTNWVSNFNLVGQAKISEKYTYKIDAKSEKSNWVYNSLNLGTDCGEKHGVVYATMMGGYSSEGENVIYAHGKKEDGTDDFENKIVVKWEDRLNKEVLDNIGDTCFITVGIEKTAEGKTYYNKFLSAYDAILYIKQYLETDMVVNVKGRLKFSLYNDNVQIQKEITSIVLSSATPDKYRATFTQSILLDKDSANLKEVDKNTGMLSINATVLDYIKSYNGIDVKGQFPFRQIFYYQMDLQKPELCKKIMDKLFKVKKGYTQTTYEGIFVETGATVQGTIDDVPDDIKELIEIGVYTEEEAIARCVGNGNKVSQLILKKPLIKLEGEQKTAIVQKFEERYTEDDLILDYLYQEKEVEEDGFMKIDDNESVPFGEGDDMSWLDEV